MTFSEIIMFSNFLTDIFFLNKDAVYSFPF